MFSIEFAVGFLILGLVLRLLLSEVVAFLIIIGVTIGWAFAYGPWAVVTFIELMVGFLVVQGLSDRFKKNE